MIEKEKIEKAANQGACLQRIQMMVWEYVGKPMAERNGVDMADKIFRDAEEVVMSDLRKEVERVKDNHQSGHIEQTEAEDALDEVLLLMKKI